MRLGIKAKQIAGVTAIVGVAVVALSGLYVTRVEQGDGVFQMLDGELQVRFLTGQQRTVGGKLLADGC